MDYTLVWDKGGYVITYFVSLHLRLLPPFPVHLGHFPHGLLIPGTWYNT